MALFTFINAGKAKITKKLIVSLTLLAGLYGLGANAVFAKEGLVEVETGCTKNNQQASKTCEAARIEWLKNNLGYDEVRWSGQWRVTQANARVVCSMKYLSRAEWKGKAVAERKVSAKEIVHGCTKENGITNGWINDDKCQNRLVMDTSQLDRVTAIDAKTKISSLSTGRYIFVLKKGENKLLVRTYDRSHFIKTGPFGLCNYDRYLYAGNKKTIRNTKKKHVRHSQLNGGWSDVWSAGELWIENGNILAISNESGHFKPAPESLKYVQETLNYLDIPTDKMKRYSVQDNKRELELLKNRCLGGQKRKL